MKASDHSTCVVPATAVEILLTLAQYISNTPCYVSKLQLLFFWLDRTERCVQERPALAWANPEIEEWSGLNGSRPCKWFPSYHQEKRAQGNVVRRRLRFRPLHSSTSGVGATATPLKDRIGRALSSTYLLLAAFRRSLSSVRPNEARLMLVIP